MPSSASLSEIAVSVRGLSKSYNIVHNAPQHTTLSEAMIHGVKNLGRKQSKETFWALKDVSFDIQKGDVVGVIGRNGAGKSTLLKVLSRITEPTRGQIDLYGRVGSLLEVGTGFHPELTGRENINLNGAILGMSKREIASHFDAIIDFAGVEQFLDTPVKRYSSGMYVRLAFAVAAHLEPEILIVDEVLAVGDAEFQKKCLGKMQDVAAHGRTVLFVSHNMGAVRGLCGSVVWMRQGGVHQFGAAAPVIDAYMRENLHTVGGSVDLSREARLPGLGERLRITRVVFNEGLPLLHAEPMHVRLEYETQSALEGVIFNWALCTLEGVPLMSFDSDIHGRRYNLPRGKKGCVDILVKELWLQPGQYALNIGVRSGDSSALDSLPACASLEILPGPQTPATLHGGAGGVRPPANWHLDTAFDAAAAQDVVVASGAAW